MGPVRISGMASGLPPNIVEQLMEAERIPLKQLEAKKVIEDDKAKLVTDLETKITDITKNVSELVGKRGFTNAKLLSGNTGIVDGTVDPETALTGEWQVEVVRLANKPGAMSNGFPDKDRTEIGVGYLRFDTNEGQKDVYITQGNSTLEGVVKAINASGAGLQAHLVNDRKDADNPYRLLVTGMATGADNQVKFPVIYMLDGDRDVYFEESRPSQNAIVKIDGFEMEVPENMLKDVLPGVTLDLKQQAPGTPVKVSVKEDMEAISGKIKSFVDSFNGALGFIQGQRKLIKDKSGKERMGQLGGDSIVRGIESTLRKIIQDPQYGTSGKINRLSDLGIEFNRNGTLNFSEEKFKKVLNTIPKDLAEFLRGDGFQTGFITRLKRDLDQIINSSYGPLGNRKRGIQAKISQIDKRIESKEKQLEKKEESLRKKFSDLESKMSGLNSQGAAVAAMSGGGAGGGGRG
jgi:flagellar hook-associated protein 2